MSANRRRKGDRPAVQRSGNPLGAPNCRPGKNRTTLRCFVALQPDEAARDRLDELAREQHSRYPQARRMRRENLHLTLAFIGELDTAMAQHLAGRLAAEAVDPFDWALVAVGAFDRASVLWAGGADARLEALAARARKLLDALEVRYDRKPFAAHVTLLRKLPRAAARSSAQDIEPPILWRTATPVLLQSITDDSGTRYAPVLARTGNSAFGEDQ